MCVFLLGPGELLEPNPLIVYVDVQRFDSRLMPPDGTTGLIHKVRRLLDTSARGLEPEGKQELLDKLEHDVVQHPR